MSGKVRAANSVKFLVTLQLCWICTLEPAKGTAEMLDPVFH
jgi:hypothetical protein